MKKNDATIPALEQVDERRRGFLKKMLAGGAAAVALPTMTTVVLAQDDAGKGKGGKGKGGKGKGGGRRPDPSTMAAQMIKNFDTTGDGSLNQQELTKALTAMMRQRSSRGKGKGGAGGGKGKGKGKGKGNR